MAHYESLLPLATWRTGRVDRCLQWYEVSKGQLVGPGVPLLNQTLTAPGVPGR